jgi:hypothetical protein
VYFLGGFEAEAGVERAGVEVAEEEVDLSLGNEEEEDEEDASADALSLTGIVDGGGILVL